MHDLISKSKIHFLTKSHIENTNKLNSPSAVYISYTFGVVQDLAGVNMIIKKSKHFPTSSKFLFDASFLQLGHLHAEEVAETLQS